MSVVNPHMCHRLNQMLCNSTNYWSQQENFLSLDHAKLLDEAARISKTSGFSFSFSFSFSFHLGKCLFMFDFSNYGVLIHQMKHVTIRSPESDEKYPHFSRVSATSETRLKWTVLLHEKFVGCVNLLDATPSAILRLMISNELALHRVKIHLQTHGAKQQHETIKRTPRQPFEPVFECLFAQLKMGQRKTNYKSTENEGRQLLMLVVLHQQ
ncbi:hypothetical protein GQ457_05G029290 [Hibiscus cannabinus]